MDYREPDYCEVFERRLQALQRLRAEPGSLPYLKRYYRDHVAQFITDWGCTYDPRNVEIGRPAVVPFVLFPRQVEAIEWMIDRWKSREPGVVPKSREVGVTWIIVALSVSLAVLYDDVTVGIGSRKEEYVDKLGDPKSIFHKIRQYLSWLPAEFRPGWRERAHAPHMRCYLPETKSTIVGEAGDNIGRGNRTSIYLVDESAFLERPTLVDASLAATTNCRIDVSSVNGLANSFAQKARSDAYLSRGWVFPIHWRDDPRKDEAWYAAKVIELNNPMIVAQELDMDYSASAEGVLLPMEWLQACVDAYAKLGVEPSGARAAGFDVADEGKDTLALAVAYGGELLDVEEWSGKGGDLHFSTVRAFALCDRYGLDELVYDADGLGAGVRPAARLLNDERRRDDRKLISVRAFRGSAAPHKPDAQDVKGRKNKDFFVNAKAQSWWALRERVFQTYRAVVHGVDVSPDAMLSIPSTLRLRNRLLSELNQPTYSLSSAGKVQVDKTPDGAPSPNLADAVMIRFGGYLPPMVVSGEAVRRQIMGTSPLTRTVKREVRREGGISAQALVRFGVRR